MKLVLAKWTADRVAAGNLPEWAAQEAMNYLKQRLNGHGGIIVLNAQGQVGIAHNTPRMAWAFKTTKKEEAGCGARELASGEKSFRLKAKPSIGALPLPRLRHFRPPGLLRNPNKLAPIPTSVTSR